MTHAKIGNGYDGFTHPSKETACGKPSKGRKIAKDYSETTCPDCAVVLDENFGPSGWKD